MIENYLELRAAVESISFPGDQTIPLLTDLDWLNPQRTTSPGNTHHMSINLARDSQPAVSLVRGAAAGEQVSGWQVILYLQLNTLMREENEAHKADSNHVPDPLRYALDFYIPFKEAVVKTVKRPATYQMTTRNAPGGVVFDVRISNDDTTLN